MEETIANLPELFLLFVLHILFEFNQWFNYNIPLLSCDQEEISIIASFHEKRNESRHVY